jgi:hypothetical protein
VLQAPQLLFHQGSQLCHRASEGLGGMVWHHSAPRARYNSTCAAGKPLTGTSAGRRSGSPVKRRGTTGKRFCAMPRAMASLISTSAPEFRMGPRNSAAR